MTRIHASESAEEFLISSCLIGGAVDVSAATGQGVTVEAFNSPANRQIWTAMLAGASEAGSTELGAIAQRLGWAGGGQSLVNLLRIERLAGTSARRAAYASEVISVARQRKLVGALKLAVEIADSQTTQDFPALWESVEPCIRKAMDVAHDHRGRTLADHIAEARALMQPGEPVGAISTPFPGWDRAAGRMMPGDLTVLAARPGCGKTALALQISDGTASSGGGVLFVSLEMPGGQLVRRLAQQRAGGRGIMQVGMHSDEFTRARAARESALVEISTLGSRMCILEPAQGGSIAKIEARARLTAASRTGLALVVVDYLQLIDPPDDTRLEHRERQVAELSRRLKLLALDLRIPVLVLAQLNREMEKEGRRPRLSDLRESGAIEQDADRVWFLYEANEAPAPSDSSVRDIKLLQAKCRHGQPGVMVTLDFRLEEVRFRPPL